MDLQQVLESRYHIQGASLRWVGIWQDPLHNQIDLVFADNNPSCGHAVPSVELG
ncbi:MAG UNVERIFIED_CONTAM: hypothetical protein LVT10_12205 [Anaerolineae bacterium]